MSERIVPHLVRQARIIAAKAHDGQTDKAGQPYLNHPARVAYAVRAAGAGPEVEAAAWLHDVLEDSPLTPQGLIALGMPPVVVEAVVSLTRQKYDEYADTVRRALANPIGAIVKKADIADNLDPSRLALLDPEEAARLRKKYTAVRPLFASLTASPRRA